MHLSSLRLKYRSFADQRLRNLSSVNILVGPNNAGKSSIFLALAELKRDKTLSHGGWAPNFSDESAQVELGFPLAPFGLAFEGRFDSHPFPEDGQLLVEFSSASPMLYMGFHQQLSDEARRLGWVKDEQARIRLGEQRDPETNRPAPISNFLRESDFWKAFHDFREGIFVLSHVRGGAEPSTQIASERLDPQARHLAGRLLHLVGSRTMDFRRQINEFVSDIIPDVGEVVVPPTLAEGSDLVQATVFFDSKGHRIPLRDLGGGVEQVLALAIILLGEPQAKTILIEEPENHLHEAAQRRLIRRIQAHLGGRQLFIATHSPVFMNGFAGARIFQVTKSGAASKIVACVRSDQQRRALDDLGVLPSTILQTSCVVWVEGPTETVLLREWLKLFDPDLLEHEHYEFVMTAGSLLAHLSVDDEEDRITRMVRVCRNAFAIHDSDAASDAKPVKEAVRKIAETLDPACVWITDDYEIEWYFPPAAVGRVWEEVDVLAVFADRGRPFYKALAQAGGPKTGEKRKVQNAQRVVKETTPEEWFGVDRELPLADDVRRLVDFIRRANDLPPA